ncbi:reverse transcriptase domain-containing protein [Tanacetum coccineum]
MLIDPEGKEYTYALCFEFETTNNKVEYEALLAGLRISQEMEIASLAIFVYSQLLVNQVKGTYAAKQSMIKEYLQKTKEALKGFDSYTIEHIRRNQNKKADALSKLASMTFEHLTKDVLVKEERIMQTDDIVKEVHKGSCGFNAEPQSMLVRITKQGYYWPSMHRDAAKLPEVSILGNSRRTLHKMGGRKTSDRYKRKACRKIRMRIRSVHIRSATNNQLEGREAFLRRNSQKETPFSLTYGSEAIIPISETNVTKDDRGRIKEVDKRRGSKEIASIEEAYYQASSAGTIVKGVVTLFTMLETSSYFRKTTQEARRHEYAVSSLMETTYWSSE